MLKTGKIIFAVFFSLLSFSNIYAAPEPVIPEQLKPWADWVLYGHEEEILCSPSYNNEKKLQCDWPSKLILNVTNQHARFSQEWLVQSEKWIQLPGNNKNWPENVLINGKETQVMVKDGTPQVKVLKGKHAITGSFSWDSIPEFITVSEHTGIIDLEVNTKKIAFPNLDANGKLWLQAKKQEEQKIENRLSLQSYRFIDDRIPMRIVTNLNIDVAGAAREIILGPALSTQTNIPVSLNSTIPARLEPDGRIRVQVRPGQWNITLTSRYTGPVSSLTFTRPDDGFWPGEEIWVFNSHPDLRVVEIEGVTSIDPLQTSLPGNWRSYPAYRLLDGDIMKFKEIKRGDPQPAPDQLTLQRNIWLRFDGTGYTIQDIISGTKKTNWRLEMNPPIELGRVAVDDKEQFITKRQGSGKTGIELRRGLLNLVADSQVHGNISKLPATGWDHDFQQVSAKVNLPPGWRLINVAGADNIHGTWVKRWTLLDFFIVLIFTIAVAKLFSKPLAVLAFFTMVLMYHEPNAPRWIWLSILVGVALLMNLPDGKFRLSIKIFQVINIIVLIAIAIPFSIQQLRTGLYPQLEKPWKTMISAPARQPSTAPQMQVEEAAVGEGVLMDSPEQDRIGKLEEKRIAAPNAVRSRKKYDYYSSNQVAQYDPAMVNQTGPGLPNWQWNTIPLSWSGPVHTGQDISLFLLGPTVNLILCFLQVILLVVLASGIFKIRYDKGSGLNFKQLRLSLLLSPLLLTVTMSPHCQAGEIPSPQMLEELQKRLLQKEDCFPVCADISQMDILITPEKLQLTLNISSQAEVSVPLPGDVKHWLPQEVKINNNPVNGLFRIKNKLWILLPPGNSKVSLLGKVPRQNSLQLPLPLKPHRVTFSSEGWTTEGIHENGTVDNQIQFKRIVKGQDISNQILQSGVLPPFVLVERTLRLGLTWKIETVVQRISPAGSAIVFSYPLLPRESIVTEGIRVKNNQAQVNLGSSQSSLRWESVIDKNDEIILKHAETDIWTEMWKVDVSPIFHMETSGIPVILHQQGDRWYPTWHPWSGEEVKLTLTRPAGVDGQTITVDKTHLEIRPGQRATQTRIKLSVRSSQGGQHTITLPENAQLQEVKINDRLQPIRQEGRRVPLPIKPGSQEIHLQWLEDEGISSIFKTPEIDLGIESVNDNIDVYIPRNRWPLFMGGPLLGPAVLFWSVVFIIILVTFGLSRTGMTPLKFRHWFLLGIGMSQSNIAGCLIVAGWLLALDSRQKIKPDMNKSTFNAMQLGIGLLTVLAVSSLIVAISQGLLGHPDMNIIGNGSHSGLLRWYQDHSDRLLPQAWVFSIPLYVYRLAMLAWALWISFSLIWILKWGWNNFTEPVLWHKIPKKPKVKKDRKKKTQPEPPKKPENGTTVTP